MSSLEELGFALEMSEDGKLGLRDLTDPKMQPLVVDFLDPQIQHRLRHGVGKNQPIGRALGLRSGISPTVFDATAGMGVDAFFIAALGCRVRAVERDPVVFRLLEDGLRRLREAPALAELAARLSFEQGDAVEILESLRPEERPDIVYLDPMCPDEKRAASALPKKAMQMFRRLIGPDLDSERLFASARAAAKQRVVVKRPMHAPALGGRPTHSFEGKTARFDMYLVE